MLIKNGYLSKLHIKFIYHFLPYTLFNFLSYVYERMNECEKKIEIDQ